MKFSVKCLGGLAALSLTLSIYTAFADRVPEIEERIEPVGDLCMVGEECAAPAPVQVADATAAGRSGKEIYDTKCATCHATGAAGAPKLGDTSAWAPRLQKGMETLYQSAINGFQGMPAKGLCFDCSDAELKAATDYMVESVK